jgi:hypothetical protein
MRGPEAAEAADSDGAGRTSPPRTRRGMRTRRRCEFFFRENAMVEQFRENLRNFCFLIWRKIIENFKQFKKFLLGMQND